jgi:glycosyltransferase involved in cell wall biosynthesis
VIAAPPPLRIAHVLHSLEGGGAERIVCDLARRRDLQTAVICLDWPGSLLDTAQRLGIHVCCTQRRAGTDWRQVGRIARFIRDWRPDIIHAHQYTPYFYAALAATTASFGPIIFTEHGRHWPDRVGPLRRAANQLLRLRRDPITAVCQFVAEALRCRECIAGRNVRLIPNGIDWRRFDRPSRRAALAEELGVPPEAPLLIQVARLRPVKDHATSLRALALLRRHHPSAQLLLIGDGPEEPRLRELADRLGIASAVHLLHRREDVPELLASSDVFMLSSLSEAASLSIMEAMAAGLPVAATDVGGNAEIVLHGRTGLLSPRGDPAALAAHLCTLLERPDLRRRFGQAGRQRIRQRFDQDTMHQAFVDLYHRISGGRA